MMDMKGMRIKRMGSKMFSRLNPNVTRILESRRSCEIMRTADMIMKVENSWGISSLRMYLKMRMVVS